MADLNLILASTSPRRKALLEQIGMRFRVDPPVRPEEVSEKLKPEERVKVLAWLKAKEVARRYKSGLVLGADTVVVLGNRVMGKPSSSADAARMLRLLSGKTHRVLTGVALLQAPAGKQKVEVVETEVRFRKLAPDEIVAYVRTGEPMDKAGAYGAQGRAASFIERIDGDFYNVVGLPLARLQQLLSTFR